MANETKTMFGAFIVYASERVSQSEYRFRLSPEEAESVVSVVVDVTKSSANARPGADNPIEWKDVLIDIDEEESPTVLRATWAERKTGLVGVVYLSKKCMSDNRLELPPPLPSGMRGSGGRLYEYQSLVSAHVSADNNRTRHYGFYARITKERKGRMGHRLGLVSVYNAGSSHDPEEEPEITFWVDFDDPLGPCDIEASTLKISNKEHWEGSIFIERQAAKDKSLHLKFPSVALNIPKGSRRELGLNALVEIP